RTARSQLAQLVVSGVQQESAEAYRKELAAAQEEEESAERDLAGKSVTFRATQARGNVGRAEVARSLPPGSALVAYVLDGRLAWAGDKAKSPSTVLDKVPSYLALVMATGSSEPHLVILGSAREIDSRIHAWRDEVSAPPRGLDVAGSRSESRYRQAGDRLR